MTVTARVLAPTIDGDRLLASIADLAEIGRLPNGGVRRTAFNSMDISARKLVQQWMQDAGLQVCVDAAGNIIGHLRGSEPRAAAIATGSHIDTVPEAGRYDGTYGVLAGIEVARVLKEQGLHLRHSYEVIVFSDEEGSMIGSKAMAGKAASDDPERYRRPNGLSIETCLERVGGNWDQLDSAYRAPGDIAAFVELHVEQGPVLESLGVPLGVVTGIVGQRRYKISVTGRANHAGTTPMPQRCDALAAAAQIVLAAQEIGNSPDDRVVTVGQLDVTPNAVNVIPGRVDLSADMRDLSAAILDESIARLRHRCEHIAAATGTEIEIVPVLDNRPAPAARHIQDAIARACEQLALSYAHLPSRASHDAQELAAIADMGMIFVPSENGVSHNATEYTRDEHCIHGANALLRTLLQLDRDLA